jgi:hypothetical protein
VKTRTLLILSALTATAILIAGIALFVRLDQAQSTVELLATGDEGRAGDARVTVLSSSNDAGSTTVNVRLGGVDDGDGLNGFRLVAPGATAAVDAAGSTCAGFTLDPVECTLTFDTQNFDGSSRQLVFQRSDAQLRWDVS